METVFVRSTPADTLATACPNWDGEGFTMTCAVSYPRKLPQQPQAPLRDAIDDQFGLSPQSFLITAGTLSLSLDADNKLVAFDFYTNASDWRAAALEPVEASQSVLRFSAPFDEFGRVGEAREADVFYDARTGTICLSWGTVNDWHLLAANLSIGLATDGRLMQIRVDGLSVPEQDRTRSPGAAGWLGAARRLFGRR
ncbi:hypothetical protein AAHK20_29930 [Trinickia sp. YCB016]